MRMRRRFSQVWFILFLCHPCRADVVLNCVFLMDMNTFTSKGLSSRLESILTSSFSRPNGITLQSIQSVSLTGAEVKQLYFPQNTDIRLFSIVHLTRVTASIRTDNDANTTKYVSNFLAPLCADLAPVAVDRIGQPSQSGFDFAQQFPPVLGFVMVCVWAVTVLSCGVCWVCVLCHCCKRKPKKTPPEHEKKPQDEKTTAADQNASKDKGSNNNSAPADPTPSAPPFDLLVPPSKRFARSQSFRESLTPPSAPPLFLMRLPSGFESADRSDPCAAPAPPSRGGPAAVRLASWPVDPPPPPT